MQESFTFIQPEDRTKYLIKYRYKCEKGTIRTAMDHAWFMDGVFILDSYYQTKEATIIERIGNEEEVFRWRE